VSGSGSNLQALLDHQAELGARVVLVVSNKPGVRALERASRAQVESWVHPTEPDRRAYDRKLAGRVAEARPDLVVLAGFMRILTTEFLDCFPGRVVNLHPALPGQYPGLDAIARALHDGRQETGCMVHYVVPEVDAGPVIDIEKVPIHPEDTLESLSERMHQAEHRLLVRAVGLALGHA
ncbi:MAG: phosphoribosylglycinamide formyltransferase, partial [Candidatus Eremiobacteraeota bacterium]|nr:phosphoribosylglycinamide formyltransferase [Candidatus Eremiobacteraeota bacterium]